MDVHKALKNDQKFTGKNLFYSPSSLSIALAMTSMGAKGNTAEQMAKALQNNEDDDEYEDDGDDDDEDDGDDDGDDEDDYVNEDDRF